MSEKVEDKGQEEIPEVLLEIWENWKQDNGGGGRCHECPAHWSIREDLDGIPGERDSSYQYRPHYGNGSLNPDIVIIAQEPGGAGAIDHSKNKREKSLSEARIKNLRNCPGGTIKNAQPLFDLIDGSEFSGYYTQTMKCDELHDNKTKYKRAWQQCCGTDHRSGYLRDELIVLDPDYVITLGEKALQRFSNVFDVEALGPESFTRELAKGEFPSGLRGLKSTDDGLQFVLFPAPHPAPYGGVAQVRDRIEIDLDTKGYFKQFALDALKFMRKDK